MRRVLAFHLQIDYFKSSWCYVQSSRPLKPNGKFSGNFFWLDMGLTNSQKEWNPFSGNRSLFPEVWLFMILFICAQLCIVLWGKNKKRRKQLEIWLILDSQELFEKWKLVVHSMLRYSRKRSFKKGFVPELRWEFIWLRVVFHTEFVACLYAQNETGPVFCLW